MTRGLRRLVATAVSRHGGTEPGCRASASMARRLVLVLAGLLAVLGWGPAFAERWSVQPSATLALGYEDNVRLVPVDAQASFSGILNAALRAVRSTEITDVGFAVGLAGTRYTDLSDLDNTSGYVGLDLGHRLERNQFRLDTRFISQSTLTSEEATTGLVQVNRQQNQFLLNPGWTYLLSERAKLDLAANFQDVSYADAGALPLFPYRAGSVDLGGSYLWTERLGLTGRLSYGRYSAQGHSQGISQGISNDYDNVGVQVGADYQLSETSTFGGLVGLRRTKQTLDDPQGLSLTQDSSGPTYALRISKRFEAGGGMNLEAKRALEPSGSGQVLDTTGLTGGLTYVMEPRWLFQFDASAYRNRYPGGETGPSDRKFVSVAPSIAYDLSESWRLSAGYRFRWQERDGTPGDAISNAVFLTLNWSGPWDL